jgi:hypothetical protein
MPKSAADKAWQKSHPEKCKIYNAKWRKKNKEKVKLSRDKNVDKYKEYMFGWQEYWLKHPINLPQM